MLLLRADAMEASLTPSVSLAPAKVPGQFRNTKTCLVLQLRFTFSSQSFPHSFHGMLFSPLVHLIHCTCVL